MNLEEITQVARSANERWVHAQLTGRRNSAAYKRAYAEKTAAQAAFLEAKRIARFGEICYRCCDVIVQPFSQHQTVCPCQGHA